MATRKKKSAEAAADLFGEGASPVDASLEGADSSPARSEDTRRPDAKSKPKKKPAKDVLGTPEADPRAPFDTARFFTAARPVLALLEKDLLERARASRGVSSALAKRHAEDTAAHRTADDVDTWTRHLVRQIAAAWLLSCVFVRVLEDRGLLSTARIAGPGAEDSERAFYGLGPSLTPRDYLRMVFRELAGFAAGADLFDARHNPVWLLGPSAEASHALLALFRAPTADTPSLRFGQSDTRFLGDLYQDLSEDVRERFALLQTPAFVERYILDRTLEPAIERFGLKDTSLLDPTCGSGHFLLGAFDRLFDHWQRAHPADDRYTALRQALDRVYGADLNPYAVAIARFRLTLSFIEKGGFQRFEDVPHVELHLAVADSLLHGPLPDASGAQRDFADLEGQRAADWRGRLFSLEDDDAARAVLNRPHAAVVGNPPYITVKDRELRELYRKHYKSSASGKYSVAAPFTEKFFLLAKKRGYVGMITANSFMKREFGKSLIEKVLPRFDLTGIVNTAGAYIPGHGTPTVILFGTHEAPQATDVWAVLGKRGEPSTPDDPSEGLVWSSIRDHGEEIGFENDYVSVARVERKTLDKHPWSLGGGGAAELKELLEERAEKRLGDVADSIGIVSFTLEDDVYLRPHDAWHRQGVGEDWLRRMVIGEAIRDWSTSETPTAFFPYHPDFTPRVPTDAALRAMWPFRSTVGSNILFGGKTKVQGGLQWFEFGRLSSDKLRTTLTIAYAEVATHNHFVLDRGGKVFKQTAPIIKLKPDATEDDHYALLAYLNSSTACFWMKQVAYPKSSSSGDISKEKGRPEAERYAFSAGAIQPIPLPNLAHWPQLAKLGRRATRLAIAAQRHAAGALVTRTQRGEAIEVENEDERREALESRLHAVQDSIDRTVTEAFSLTDEHLAQLASPAYSRQWTGRRGVFGHGAMTSAEQLRVAAVTKLWDLVEDLISKLGRVHRRNEIVSFWLDHAPCRRFLYLLDDYESIPSAIVGDIEAVPYLARLRYTEKGLEKRAAWERTWELQRREDENARKKAEGRWGPGDVEALAIPVPPKYDPKDFKDPAYYRLRGKLDVPKERFISYPGCESDDDKQPLYGWAGWNHLQQAQALAALYEDRKREGWTKERLAPMLEGLRELLPWLKQWHNDPSEEFGGLKLGDYFEGYVEGEERG